MWNKTNFTHIIHGISLCITSTEWVTIVILWTCVIWNKVYRLEIQVELALIKVLLKQNFQIFFLRPIYSFKQAYNHGEIYFWKY